MSFQLPPDPGTAYHVQRLGNDRAFLIATIVRDNPSAVRARFVRLTGTGQDYGIDELVRVITLRDNGRTMNAVLNVPWRGQNADPDTVRAMQWMRGAVANDINSPSGASKYAAKSGPYFEDNDLDNYPPGGGGASTTTDGGTGGSAIDWTSVLNTGLGVVGAFFAGMVNTGGDGAATVQTEPQKTSALTYVLWAVGALVVVVVGVLIYRASK